MLESLPETRHESFHPYFHPYYCPVADGLNESSEDKIEHLPDNPNVLGRSELPLFPS